MLLTETQNELLFVSTRTFYLLLSLFLTEKRDSPGSAADYTTRLPRSSSHRQAPALPCPALPCPTLPCAPGAAPTCSSPAAAASAPASPPTLAASRRSSCRSLLCARSQSAHGAPWQRRKSSRLPLCGTKPPGGATPCSPGDPPRRSPGASPRRPGEPSPAGRAYSRKRHFRSTQELRQLQTTQRQSPKPRPWWFSLTYGQVLQQVWVCPPLRDAIWKLTPQSSWHPGSTGVCLTWVYPPHLGPQECAPPGSTPPGSTPPGSTGVCPTWVYPTWVHRSVPHLGLPHLGLPHLGPQECAPPGSTPSGSTPPGSTGVCPTWVCPTWVYPTWVHRSVPHLGLPHLGLPQPGSTPPGSVPTWVCPTWVCPTWVCPNLGLPHLGLPHLGLPHPGLLPKAPMEAIDTQIYRRMITTVSPNGFAVKGQAFSTFLNGPLWEVCEPPSHTVKCANELFAFHALGWLEFSAKISSSKCERRWMLRLRPTGGATRCAAAELSQDSCVKML